MPCTPPSRSTQPQARPAGRTKECNKTQPHSAVSMGGINKKKPSSKAKGKDKGPKQPKEAKRPAPPKEVTFSCRLRCVPPANSAAPYQPNFQTITASRSASVTSSACVPQKPADTVMHDFKSIHIVLSTDISLHRVGQEELQALPQERVAAVRLFWERVVPDERPELLMVNVAELRSRAATLTERYQKQAGALCWKFLCRLLRCLWLTHISAPFAAIIVPASTLIQFASSCVTQMRMQAVCPCFAAAAEIAEAEAAGEELLPLPIEPTLSEVLEEGLARLQTDTKTWKVGCRLQVSVPVLLSWRK